MKNSKLYLGLLKKGMTAHQAFQISNNKNFIEKNIGKIINFLDGNSTPECLFKYFLIEKKYDN